MATKLRGGPVSGDTTTAPSGTVSNSIFYDHGNGVITVYVKQGIEGSDTIYRPVRTEPKAVGVTYTASTYGGGG